MRGVGVEHLLEGTGRRAGVLGKWIGDLGAAVAELGAGTAGFNDGDPDTERSYLLGHRLGEPLETPLRRVVQRVTGERNLSSVTRHLDDASTARLSHVRQNGAGHLDGGGEIGGNDGDDLFIAEFLCSAEQSVAGIVHGDVDATEIGDGPVDDRADCFNVAHINNLDTERLGILLGEVGHRLQAANRTDDTITAVEQLFGQVTAETAAHSRDEPGALSHDNPSRLWAGAASLRTRSPLSVRG